MMPCETRNTGFIELNGSWKTIGTSAAVAQPVRAGTCSRASGFPSEVISPAVGL